MNYTQLPDTYKFDVIADAIYGREVEFFHFDFDRINFEHLLTTTPPGEEWDAIQQRHSETMERIASVRRYIAALQAQITDPAAYADAVERAKAKRAAT